MKSLKDIKIGSKLIAILLFASLAPTAVISILDIKKADKELMAPGDRPIEIVKGGHVREDLLV